MQVLCYFYRFCSDMVKKYPSTLLKISDQTHSIGVLSCVTATFLELYYHLHPSVALTVDRFVFCLAKQWTSNWKNASCNFWLFMTVTQRFTCKKSTVTLFTCPNCAQRLRESESVILVVIKNKLHIPCPVALQSIEACGEEQFQFVVMWWFESMMIMMVTGNSSFSLNKNIDPHP